MIKEKVLRHGVIILHLTSISISTINKYSSMDQNSCDNDGRISSGPFSAKFPKSFSKLRCCLQNASLANQGMTLLSLSLGFDAKFEVLVNIFILQTRRRWELCYLSKRSAPNFNPFFLLLWLKWFNLRANQYDIASI